jgi:serine/threonine-protein kinase RsbT
MERRELYYVVPKTESFEEVGVVSTGMKAGLEKMGVEGSLVRRVAVICFEAEMNLVLYTTRGGNIRVVVDPERVDVFVQDDGPGMENVEEALQPGYSTAPMWIHELGFGAGMGLPNMKRNSDVFEIKSELGKGTFIHAVVFRRRDAA